MYLEWMKERLDTGEIRYSLYDNIIKRDVATIRKVKKWGKCWRVQILDRAPWHRTNLKGAQGDALMVYEATKND